MANPTSKPAITTISGGLLPKNNPSLAPKRYKTNSKMENSKRPTLGFSDADLVNGIPNGDLPLLITA
ncbi:hypothetical protein A2U01_0075980, partial [Trifolium medium]|nr:hypothetical protein [Trifolium medium]